MVTRYYNYSELFCLKLPCDMDIAPWKIKAKVGPSFS